MKKLLISLILVSNINIYSMKEDKHGSNNSYISLKSEPGNQDDQEDPKELPQTGVYNRNYISVPDENDRMYLSIDMPHVAMRAQEESKKEKFAKYACKTYCTPKAFKDCACGILAIVFMVSLYKIYNIAESMSDPSNLGNN